jgi:WD40 repeat protein
MISGLAQSEVIRMGIVKHQGFLIACVSGWLLSAPFLAAEEPRVLATHQSGVNCIAYTPEGQLLASGGFEGVILLQKLRFTDPPIRLDAELGPLECLAFSPDGTKLAACYREPAPWRSSSTIMWYKDERWSPRYSLVVWDHARREQCARLESRVLPTISCLAFSPDGRSLAASSDEDVLLWEMATGKQRAALRRVPSLEARRADYLEKTYPPNFRPRVCIQEYDIHAIALSPDGKLLASRAFEDVIRVWQVPTQKEAFQLDCSSDEGGPVAFTPDGRLLVAAVHSPGNDWVWKLQISDLKSSRPWKLRVWDLKSREPVQTIAAHGRRIQCLAISPDGKVTASGGDDEMLRLWETATGKELACWHGPAESITNVTFAEGGTSLITGSSDGTVRLWAPPALKRSE